MESIGDLEVKQKVVVIDNYDSFVYNLVQYLGEAGADPLVFRNDKISVSDVLRLNPDAILISPGPGVPARAGITNELIQTASHQGTFVFGVCLGHQAIGETFGSRIIRAPHLMHGKTSMIAHDGEGVFADLPSPFRATRYHSLIVEEATLSPDLIITARSEDGLIMGLRHRSLPAEGVQFHPESIMTDSGRTIVANFLKISQATKTGR